MSATSPACSLSPATREFPGVVTGTERRVFFLCPLFAMPLRSTFIFYRLRLLMRPWSSTSAGKMSLKAFVSECFKKGFLINSLTQHMSI